MIKEHKQFDISRQTRSLEQTVRPFELGASNINRTDKDLNIKNLHTVTDTETKINHGQKVKLREIKSGDTASPTLLLNDYILGISDVVVSRTVSLPNPSLAGFGKVYIIKDISGSASATTISITPFASETISGDSGDTINTDFGARRYFTNGTNWFQW